MNPMYLLAPSLVLLAPAPFLATFVPSAQEGLRPPDIQSLGKDLAEYVDAWRKNKGTDKARAAVATNLEKLKKRFKDRDPLSMTADIGKAMWESLDYSTSKGVKKGRVSEVVFTEKESELEVTYAVWAPAKYDPKKAYPIILCIPEKGEKATDHLTEKWISPTIRDNAVLAAVSMPEDVSQWSEVGSQGKWGGGANLFTVFREVTRSYATDYDRVYLAGRGEGVAATAATASRNLDRFAGVIGRSGDPGELPVENFKNLPTFFAGAGAGATAFAEKCTKAGYDNCIVKPEGTEEDVWAWIQDHPRISNPAEVVLLPGTPLPYKAYWLEIPPWDGQGTAIIRAKIDRASNTVTVDGEGVTGVVLYFNDILVDLEKPVKVVCNGIGEHLDLIPRSLNTTLDLYVSSRSDPGKLYTATHTYDLPAKPKPK
jgi:hypothetical protein